MENKMCRLCGNVENNMLNIFEKDAKDIQYIHKIKSCVPIVIYRTDPLSKVLCRKCVVKVDEYYEFRNASIMTNEEYISRIKDTDETSVLLYLNAVKNYSVQNEEITPLTPVKRIPSPDSSCNIKSENVTPEKNTALKILTPSLINNSLVETKCASSSVDENVEPEDKKWEPLSLLQCALRVINSVLQGKAETSQPDDKLDLKVSNSGSNASRLVGNRRFADRARGVGVKRCLEDKTNLLKEWLQSQNLGIKRVKLESVNPQEPEITICLEGESSDSASAASEEYEEERWICQKCKKTFDDICQLALHEQKHIKSYIGPRVDSVEWSHDGEDLYIRDKWLYDIKEENELCEEEDNKEDIKLSIDKLLSVSISTEPDEVQKPPVIETNANNTLAPTTLFGGVEFRKLDPKVRRSVYKSSISKGRKVYVCPKCRHCFKDAWSLDKHFINYTCTRICTFCNLEFDRDNVAYLEHFIVHKNEKNFLFHLRKAKKQYYRYMQIHRRNHTMKLSSALREALNYTGEHVAREVVKTIPVPAISNPKEPVNRPSQAYYCRKCYRIFYKLSELQMHFNKCQEFSADAYSIIPEINPPAMTYSIDSAIMQRTPSIFDRRSSPIVDRKPFPVVDKRPSPTVDKKSPPIIDRRLSSIVENRPSPSPSSRSSDGNPTWECTVCCCAFPSSQSRNSHMRIHKRAPQESIKIPIPVQMYSSQDFMMDRPTTSSMVDSSNVDVNLARLIQSGQLTIRTKSSPSAPTKIQVPQSQVPSTAVPKPRPAPQKTQNAPTQNTPPTPKPIKCIPCGQTFPSKHHLYFHKKTCDFLSTAELIPIPQQVHQSQSVQEPSSSVIRPSQASLIRKRPDGAWLVPSVKKFKCNPCNKRFGSKAALYSHKKNDCKKLKTGKTYECPFCKRKFGTQAQYTTHILYDHPE